MDNKNVTVKTKCKVYRTVVLSTMLHKGTELKLGLSTAIESKRLHSFEISAQDHEHFLVRYGSKCDHDFTGKSTINGGYTD